MKRLLIVLTIFWITLVPAYSQWRIETVDASGYKGRFTAIAVDRFGYPHISYLDEDSKDLRYARRSFSGWTVEIIDTFGVIDSNTSLVLDHRDVPHICYYEKSDRDLWYATKENDAWVTELVDSEGWSGGGPDIEVDSLGNPHISYLMDHPVIHVKYAVRDDAGWTVEKIGDDEIFGRATSLVLDRSMTPHICYLFGWNLVLGTRTDSSWRFEIMFDAMQRGRSTSLEMDADGNLHAGHTGVSFGTASQELNILYTFPRQEGTWETEVVDTAPFDGDDLIGWEQNMMLDADSAPHIVYYSISDGNLKYAFQEESVWVSEVIDDTGDVGTFNSAVMDEDGFIHVSYHDETNLDLKYATNSPESSVETGMFLSVPEMASPGLPFWVDGYAVNTGLELPDTAVFVILDISDALWFWPTWSSFDPVTNTGINFELLDLMPGVTQIDVLPEIIWPDTGNSSASGIHFISALVDRELSVIIGNVASVEFGYGPSQ